MLLHILNTLKTEGVCRDCKAIKTWLFRSVKDKILNIIGILNRDFPSNLTELELFFKKINMKLCTFGVGHLKPHSNTQKSEVAMR